MGYDTEEANRAAEAIADEHGLFQRDRVAAVEGLWDAVCNAADRAGLRVNGMRMGYNEFAEQQAVFEMEPTTRTG